MLLTFTLPKFENLIKSGIKKHTIRVDKTNRWKVGRPIEFWKGNPRNKTANPYQFGTGICTRFEWICIDPIKNEITIGDTDNQTKTVFTDAQSLNDIAVNDGFDNWEEMKTFFTEPIIGKLIFWSNFKPTK